MCTRGCIEFGKSCLDEKYVQGKRVIEVGAWSETGSLRPHVESLHPESYIGIDLVMGEGVDELCDVRDMVRRFGKEAFDLLISTEVLEHVRNWREAVRNFKRVLRSGGALLVTARSQGYRVHGYPHDCWRFEEEDFRHIFSDLECAGK